MLTKKQNFFMEKIRNLSRRNGVFPTVREIARATGLSSPATIHAYLGRLQARGALLKADRTWEFADKRLAGYGRPLVGLDGYVRPLVGLADGRPPVGLTVPLVGMVPAGPALEIFESLGDEVVLPEWLAEKGGDIVAFRVQGQSMKDAYIQDNDLVLIKKTGQADPGQMVVARLQDGSITLKRLKLVHGAFILAPENPDYQPITASFQLVGKVVGVLRRYR